jgi:hypothetical protein
MDSRITVNLTTTRSGLILLPPEARKVEARRSVKMFLVPRDSQMHISDSMIPDFLVTDSMIERFLEISPPIATVIREFQQIINKIGQAYILGNLFSALSASRASSERLLNLTRIQLHKHHSMIKELWGKGPSNAWDENIDALNRWGYFHSGFAKELKWIFKNFRCKYLHSGEILDLPADTLRSVRVAYHVLIIFLGFPEDLFRFSTGTIECLNLADPRFIEFYRPSLMPNEGESTSPAPESGPSMAG